MTLCISIIAAQIKTRYRKILFSSMNMWLASFQNLLWKFIIQKCKTNFIIEKLSIQKIHGEKREPLHVHPMLSTKIESVSRNGWVWIRQLVTWLKKFNWYFGINCQITSHRHIDTCHLDFVIFTIMTDQLFAGFWAYIILPRYYLLAN